MNLRIVSYLMLVLNEQRLSQESLLIFIVVRFTLNKIVLTTVELKALAQAGSKMAALGPEELQKMKDARG